MKIKKRNGGSILPRKKAEPMATFPKYLTDYESVFVENKLATGYFERKSIVAPDFFDNLQEMHSEYNKMFRSLTDVVWLNYAKSWFFAKEFLYMKKSGIVQPPMDRSTRHIGWNIRFGNSLDADTFFQQNLWNFLRDFFRELYPDVKIENYKELDEKLKFPWENLCIDHVMMVINMPERKALLDEMNNLNFDTMIESYNFIINYLGKKNDLEGWNKYLFHKTPASPYHVTVLKDEQRDSAN